MNKMIKLPLFLGICGGVCAGILAGVYAFTNPIIQQNKKDLANKAIFEAFSEFGDKTSLTISDPLELSDDLKRVGVTSKQSVSGGTLTGVGMVYACTTTKKGYSDFIQFQVTIADGKFLSYTDLGNAETKSLISEMNGKISGETVDGYSFAVKSGETFTSNAIKSALDVIAADYAATK